MGQDPELRAATADDERAVEALLAAEGLPPAASAEGSTHFLVIDDGGEVIAAAGIESCGTVALLRSVVVVAPTHRERGLARRLTESLVAEARAFGHEALYLLTTDAAAYFTDLDFVAVDREGAPEAIRRSREYREQCPDSAVLMRRAL